MLRRTELHNGLRVLVNPYGTAPVAGVGVHYDVGFRSEPRGRSGFAHLFEHLMFQGGTERRSLEHYRAIQSVGGSFNASTHPDYTNYIQVVPSDSLADVLALEADRMRGPRFTDQDLRTQVAIIKNEISQNVLDKPYGGIPWIYLPQVMYTNFANSHNGYGDLSDLEAATADECRAFFETYYSPGNAVLTVCGDLDAEATFELVEAYFGDIAPRPTPGTPELSELAPDEDRYGVHHDAKAPAPAVVVGYRLPDPAGSISEYLGYLATSSLLRAGDGRLHGRLVQDEGAIAVDSGCGLFGRPLDARAPDTMTFVCTHPQWLPTERVLQVLDEELARLACDPPGHAELRAVQAQWRTRGYRENDQLSIRALRAGTAELLHGDASVALDLPDHVAAVTPDQVASTARALLGAGRAVLTVEPAG